ncbi:PREDICTED: pentatricopeptide repeat-containing protein At4g21065-like [Nelumbo nucifera]|uniref:DYW domain-containing protein n=2 Tax=Nelumbo nucifera TaxID=4432 RepID=A0A822YK82_NELNU|nr:PREDICTED: pentatricopeptide repeat-containing protein At4g21065-like [Nelumbo nucifera]DAD31385.1 TPA_asm: hypothetical protein HUJ06_010236 [Nelumbo nucifera]
MTTRSFFSSLGISTTSSRWIQFSSICTSSISLLTKCPVQMTQQQQPLFLLKSITDYNHMKQFLGHIITNNIAIDEFSLMKLIDLSFSSSGSDVSAHLFTQFQDFINSEICTSMIRSFTHSNKHFLSIFVYIMMHKYGYVPDSSTFPAVLKSTAQVCRRRFGKSVHAYIFQTGFNSDVFTNTALVHMYATCTSIGEARRLFDEMPVKNSVSWNALITGYTHNRKFREAISTFREMQISGFEPGEVTMVGVLSACGHLGALNQGKWIHDYIVQKRLRLNVFVGTALIDMYAKCGVVDEAEKVFGAMRVKNVYTWNVLISGFTMNGQGEAALQAFSRMVMENFKPDGVTLLAVLCACCRQGLIKEGRRYFVSMEKEYGLRPGIEHYGCMVDLLGRAGFLNEAQELIRTMPYKPDPVVWRALLGACRIHGSTQLGEVAIRNLLGLEPNNGENYVLLSNLYARGHRWTKVGEVRDMMNRKGIRKIPGCSSIEVDDAVYEFVVSNSLDVELGEVYNMLADMKNEMKLAGYVAETEMVSYDIEEEEKENSLMYHSEKLALAFGLLKTSSDSTIRIVKNLRICKDCHGFCKIVSKIYKRNIVVRDRNLFHHFAGGLCSCKDYW